MALCLFWPGLFVVFPVVFPVVFSKVFSEVFRRSSRWVYSSISADVLMDFLPFVSANYS